MGWSRFLFQKVWRSNTEDWFNRQVTARNQPGPLAVWVTPQDRAGNARLHSGPAPDWILRVCKVAQSCPTLSDPMDCSPPGSSVPGILQAGALEWAAMPSSRGSSRPRTEPVSRVSCLGRRALHLWRRSESIFISSPGTLGFPGVSAGKESACNAGDLGLIPALERSPGEGKGYPLQYSGLENSMLCMVHGVTTSQTQLSNFHFQGNP